MFGIDFRWGWGGHSHRWDTTVYNRYASPLEQRCKCGAVRHIIGWDDIDMSGGFPGKERWRDGPRPPQTGGAP